MYNTKKQSYDVFCEKTYIPIFSQPWWMDAVCGEDNWDVWLYYSGEDVVAAMPYYKEKRGEYDYITKAPLTQINGIIFKHNPDAKLPARADMEEKIIDTACDYIESLEIDVYEQQFHHSFQNWQPFFWRNYTNTLRYTYVIEDTSDLAVVMNGYSANYRKNIRKGQSLTTIYEDVSMEEFYSEHEKIFLKQGMLCPFSFKTWERIYNACILHEAGKIICAKDELGNIHSLMFVIWDKKQMYPLLGGYIPEFSSSQSYPALTHYSIGLASARGLAYDFEGSMIKRIAKSFRQFGGVPKPYYRIRKVFNPDIVRAESEQYIEKVKHEKDDE